MKFQRGQSGNPAGRPKGAKSVFSRLELESAIKKVEKEKKKSLYEHLVQRAYENDAVLIALVKKLLPDSQDVETKEDWIDSELQFSFDKPTEQILNKYILQ